MNTHYDVAKAEMATRLHDAENRRAAKRARTQQRPGPRWRRRWDT